MKICSPAIPVSVRRGFTNTTRPPLRTTARRRRTACGKWNSDVPDTAGFAPRNIRNRLWSTSGNGSRNGEPYMSSQTRNLLVQSSDALPYIACEPSASNAAPRTSGVITFTPAAAPIQCAIDSPPCCARSARSARSFAPISPSACCQEIARHVCPSRLIGSTIRSGLCCVPPNAVPFTHA